MDNMSIWCGMTFEAVWGVEGAYIHKSDTAEGARFTIEIPAGAIAVFHDFHAHPDD